MRDRLRRGGRGVHTHAFFCFSQATSSPNLGNRKRERKPRAIRDRNRGHTHTEKHTRTQAPLAHVYTHALPHENYSETPPPGRKRSQNRTLLSPNQKQETVGNPDFGSCQPQNLTSKPELSRRKMKPRQPPAASAAPPLRPSGCVEFSSSHTFDL